MAADVHAATVPRGRRLIPNRRRSDLPHMQRVCLLGALVASILACGAEPPASSAVGIARISDGPHPVAVLQVAELGEIHIELLPEIAPKTVANFEKLLKSGFYDGTSFHRVIPGFMIQGGDPLTKNHDPRDDGRGNPGWQIEDEFTDFPHARGSVSMANTGTPHSAGCQFFIVQADSEKARALDGEYAVFGRVIQGIEVVDAIAALEIDKFGRYGPPDRPYPESAIVTRALLTPANAALALANAPSTNPDRD